MIKIKLKGVFGEVEIEQHPVDKYFSPKLDVFIREAVIAYKAMAVEEKEVNNGAEGRE